MRLDGRRLRHAARWARVSSRVRRRSSRDQRHLPLRRAPRSPRRHSAGRRLQRDDRHADHALLGARLSRARRRGADGGVGAVVEPAPRADRLRARHPPRRGRDTQRRRPLAFRQHVAIRRRRPRPDRLKRARALRGDGRRDRGVVTDEIHAVECSALLHGSPAEGPEAPAPRRSASRTAAAAPDRLRPLSVRAPARLRWRRRDRNGLPADVRDDGGRADCGRAAARAAQVRSRDDVSRGLAVRADRCDARAAPHLGRLSARRGAGDSEPHARCARGACAHRPDGRGAGRLVRRLPTAHR